MARERKFTTDDLFRAVKEILLEYGYEGFTFSLLAERLEVSRGAIYKYYENKDKLITDFMSYEMQKFILELKQISHLSSFEKQFDFLMNLIFEHAEVHHLVNVVKSMLLHSKEDTNEHKEVLEKLPLEMYRTLHNFIKLGKEEGKIKEHIPDSLMLGLIFQTIAIPNHTAIPKTEWISGLKEILSHGMFKS